MLISHKYKFVYLANPKTGSASIRHMLQKYSDIAVFSRQQCQRDYGFDISPHINAEMLKKFFAKQGWNWNDYYVFTTIRNPWERLVSYYIYSKPDANGINFYSDTDEYDPSTQSQYPFDKWLEIHEYYSTAYPVNIFATYDKSSANKSNIDKIIVLENLATELPELFQTLKLPLFTGEEILHYNTTDRKHYSLYYNNDTDLINAVAKHYSEDIKLGNYQFKRLTYQFMPVTSFYTVKLDQIDLHSYSQIKKNTYEKHTISIIYYNSTNKTYLKIFYHPYQIDFFNQNNFLDNPFTNQLAGLLTTKIVNEQGQYIGYIMDEGSTIPNDEWDQIAREPNVIRDIKELVKTGKYYSRDFVFHNVVKKQLSKDLIGLSIIDLDSVLSFKMAKLVTYKLITPTIRKPLFAIFPWYRSLCYQLLGDSCRISIVSGTLNRCKLLPELLKNTIYANPRIELILVDGGSTDGTIEYLSEIDHPSLKLVQLGKRSGYPHFMNVGLQVASYPYIAQWNDDILIKSSWEDVFKILNQEPDHQGYTFSYESYYNGRVHQNALNGEITTFIRPDCMNFGIYRREVYEKVGIYNNAYDFYHADSDMTRRVLHMGGSIRLCPEIVLEELPVPKSALDSNLVRDYKILTLTEKLYQESKLPYTIPKTDIRSRILQI